MTPRRPGLPAKQRSSPGSGPAGPENFGYFPSLESSPPAGGTSPKTKQRFRRCGGEFLSERSERNERIAGADSPCQGEMSRSDRGGRDRGFWERPAANALVFHEPLSPGPPVLRGEPEGCVGSCGRRGALMKGVQRLSLPLPSRTCSDAPTRYNAPKWFNIHRGCYSAGG